MKILKYCLKVVFAMLVLVPVIAKGQKKYIENSFPVHTTTHPVSIPSGWILPLNSEDCNRNWIVKYNQATGSYRQFAEPDSANFPAFIINDITTLPSGAFICAGVEGKSADVLTDFHPYFFKMDSVGKIIWQDTFLVNANNSEVGHTAFERVISAPDGSIYALTSDGFLGKAGSSGHMIWFKKITGANDIVWTSKGLTVAANGITIIDTAGNSIKNYTLPGNFNPEKLKTGTNNTLYAKDANHIYKLDSSFQVIDSFVFIGYGIGSPTNLIVNHVGDSAYYFARGNSVKAFDFSGNLLWTNYLPTDCNVTGLATNISNYLAVAGSTSTSAFIKTYDKNGNTYPINRDVSIVKLKPQSISMHATQVNFGTVSCKMDITLKNVGSETIDSLYLLDRGPLWLPNYFCSDEYVEAFHNLNLASGDTTTLHILIERTWDAPMVTSYPLSISLRTSSPNGKLDIEPSNDTANYSQTVLGIKSMTNKLTGIKIYPNPAHNILHIDNNTEDNTCISVQDVTGKELMAIRGARAKFDLDLTKLRAGIYFIKVWNQSGMYVEKMVKE